MKKNIGFADKIIRLILAFILLLVIWFNLVQDKTWQIAVLVIALIAALTSFLEYCPIYSILKINTRKEEA
ncbi:MAG: DUF2892 domain-containing protein [Chlorobi bacterium]|nr:DUF2892 domain-containing protein [Chlorobiota bacterium]